MDPKLFKEQENQIPLVFNQFDLGNHSVTTLRAGELVPIYHQRIIPNTRGVNIRAELYGRLLTLLNPIMDQFDLFVYHFFVPTRITFPQFDRFRAGQKKAFFDSKEYSPLPPRSSVFTLAKQSCFGWMQNALINTRFDPAQHLNYLGFWTNSLLDYYNLPSTNEVSFQVDPLNPPTDIDVIATDNNSIFELDSSSSLYTYYIDDKSYSSYFAPHNAEESWDGVKNFSPRRLLIEPFIGYTLIWYDYFRNWRLEDYKYSPYDFISECSEKYNNDYTNYFLDLQPADKDCLNFFKVRKRDFVNDMFISAYPRPQLGDAVNIPQFKDFILRGVDDNIISGNINLANDFVVTDSGSRPIRFNFANGDVPTIDELHKAEQAQKFLQLFMIHGIQAKDIDKMLYGVNSSIPYDNPIFLGGEKLSFRFDEVIQTSSSTEDQPLGDFAGRGYVSGNSDISNFTADEYGYYHCIACVVPRSSYFQGLPREFTRYFDYMELPNPLFANLGFDNIFSEELNWCIPIQGTGMNDFSVNSINAADFGYMTRYIDQRTHNNEIHGSFRTSLQNWHTARIFKSNHPVPLNIAFTNVDYKAFERIFAIQQYAYPNFLLEIKMSFDIVQPLSYYCNPSI